MRFVIEIAITSLLVWFPSTCALTIKIRGNPLGLDYDPAPSPEDGPPLSAGALRDPAYLPAEIGGIVGAYVFVVSAILLALFTYGRRLRLAAEASKQVLSVEMIQPKQAPTSAVQQYPSPLSPTSGATSHNFSWPSPQKADRNPYVFPTTTSPQSPTCDPSVDVRVVEADRQNLNKGLEDLYAHVMAHEDAKAASRIGSATSLPPPPLRPPTEQIQPLPQSSPQRLTKNTQRPRPAAIDTDAGKPQRPQSRTSSFMSSLSRKKSGVRSMHISSPLPTPLSQTFSYGNASDEEPLSPAHYSPPPPPPIPKDQIAYKHVRNNSSISTKDPSPVSPVESIDAQLAGASKHQVYKLAQASIQPMPPMANPLQSNPRNGLTITTHTNTSTTSLAQSFTGSTRTLPFRAFDPPDGHLSAITPTTKTTVLERKAPAVRSPGLKSPWTAGTVPYSPYQPQTPLTPYSPTLVTKQDRKIRKKLEGRTAVLEMIKSDDEIWDSGY